MSEMEVVVVTYRGNCEVYMQGEDEVFIEETLQRLYENELAIEERENKDSVDWDKTYMKEDRMYAQIAFCDDEPIQYTVADVKKGE